MAIQDDFPGFKRSMLDFTHYVQLLSEQLMTCFARGLGFADDFFINAHDISRLELLTIFRLIHCFATPLDGELHHRAGLHYDYDFLTLLFTKGGPPGSEVQSCTRPMTVHRIMLIEA